VKPVLQLPFDGAQVGREKRGKWGAAGGGTGCGAEEAIEVGGGADMRGQAVSERERGGERWRWWVCRARKVGRAAGKKKGREGWAGLAWGKGKGFVLFFFLFFFSNPFQTKFSNLLNQFFKQIFTNFFIIILRTFSQIF
jgi:hypothetical protein